MTHLLSQRPASGQTAAHQPGPEQIMPGQIVSARIVIATARRVLAQLRDDRRTVALLLVVPSLLLAADNQMFDSQPAFDRVALSLLGIFPFITMFLVTSVACCASAPAEPWNAC